MAISSSGGTWGQAVQVTAPLVANNSNFNYLDRVSCAGAGDCSAVGSWEGFTGLLATESGGQWSAAAPPPEPSDGSGMLVRGISCWSSGN